MMMMTLMMTQPVAMLLRRMDVGLLIDSSLFVLLLCRVGFGYYGCQIIRVTLIICAGGGVIIHCITNKQAFHTIIFRLFLFFYKETSF